VIDSVDALHADHTVVATYDEFNVTATFDGGEVAGLIDHLVVTPAAYHIVDYKTNDIGVGEVSEKAAYYRPQMAAYAVALHQHDPDKRVTATLYFTTPAEPHRFTWTPSELATLTENLETELLARVDGR
jgi:ATP-dependent helicase/nuclease subunit A